MTMYHLEKKEVQEKISTLLRQYVEYQNADSQQKKKEIGEAMKYADPVIWIMYKYEAYKSSDHEIKTLEALRHHSLDHGGICAKRFDFLTKEISQRFNMDFNDYVLEHKNLDLGDFCRTEIMNTLVADVAFCESWSQYEYHTEEGQTAKWENYTT